MKCTRCQQPVERGHEFNDGKRNFHPLCWKRLHSDRPDFQYVRYAQQNGCLTCKRIVGEYDWFFSKVTGTYYHLRCGKPLHEPRYLPNLRR